METHRRKKAGERARLANAVETPTPETSKAFIIFMPEQHPDTKEWVATIACTTEGPVNDANPAHMAMKAVAAKISEILTAEMLAQQTLGMSQAQLEAIASGPPAESGLILPGHMTKP